MHLLASNRAVCTLLALPALLGGCAIGPKILPASQQHVIDRKITDYPTGMELKPFIVNLNEPTGFCFDDAGNVIVAEGGIDGADPRIYAIKLATGARTDIYPIGTRVPIIHSGFRIYGPVGGIACFDGKIYVSHRDSTDMGMITAFGMDGSHNTVVAGFPTQGDYGMTDIAVSPVNGGRLYFGVGATTNSAVVGLDNWEEGWIRDHPGASDSPALDIKLLGYRFDAKNPLASIFTPDIAVTVPFEPFGVSQITNIPHNPFGKPTGAIFSISPGGGDLRIEAWGVRNPAGLAVNEYNRVYFTDQGMELRGTRPIYNDPDALYRLVQDAWYGWPDFSRSLEPISDPKYQLPGRMAYMVISTGYPDVGFLIDHLASKLSDPDHRLIGGLFEPLSGASKMVFIPDNGPLREYAGNLVVALWGDRAPFATSDQPLKNPPPGYKLVRVDPDSGEVKDFVFNVAGGPASKLAEGRDEAIERPIDVKFGPDGNLYILDFGQLRMKGGEEKTKDNTGKIFKLSPISTPPPSTLP